MPGTKALAYLNSLSVTNKRSFLKRWLQLADRRGSKIAATAAAAAEGERKRRQVRGWQQNGRRIFPDFQQICDPVVQAPDHRAESKQAIQGDRDDVARASRCDEESLNVGSVTENSRRVSLLPASPTVAVADSA